jgi:hypothetical protein
LEEPPFLPIRVEAKIIDEPKEEGLTSRFFEAHEFADGLNIVLRILLFRYKSQTTKSREAREATAYRTRCAPQKPLQVTTCMTPGADSSLYLRCLRRRP